MMESERESALEQCFGHAVMNSQDKSRGSEKIEELKDAWFMWEKIYDDLLFHHDYQNR